MKALRLSQVLALGLLAAGLAALVVVGLSGPVGVSLFTLNEGGTTITVGLYLDLLSAVLLTFVASIALIVATYSRRNLRGQRRLSRFGLLLSASFLSLAVMVTGASLPVIALGWTVSGLLLAELVNHRDSREAQRAGSVVRRTLLVGDAMLWTGVVAAAIALPTLDRARLAEVVAPSAALTLAALALAVAAVVRSALVPTWGWLPLTAEAPSPVSAYLHAGIVNGAAVLVALVWPIFAVVPVVLGLFIVVGAVTAVIATIAGKHRPDVKGQLAASTSAQMGYMTIQLGLGLPAAAVLHLVGHGYYKAWMFLRAGGAVTRRRTESPSPELTPAARAGGVVVAVVAVVGVLSFVLPRIIDTVMLFGPAGLFPISAAGATAAVAVYSLWSRATRARWRATLISLLATLGLLTAYLFVLTAWDNVLAGILPEAPVWPQVVAAGWLLVLAAAAAVAVVGVTAAARNPDGRLAVAAFASAVPPGARGRRGAPQSIPATSAPVDPGMVRELVSSAAQLVGPAFPLRNAVAANPLAGLEGLPFIEAARIAERTSGARAYLPEDGYLRLLQQQRLTVADIDAVLADHTWGGHPFDPAALRDELLQRAERGDSPPASDAEGRVLAQRRESTGAWSPAEVAAMLDALWSARVWGAAETAAAGQLWARWRVAAAHGWGARLGLKGLAAELPADPTAAVADLLRRSLLPPSEWFPYIARLLTRSPGWAAHAAWREREGMADAILELVAVRMAHDLAVGGPAQPEESSVCATEPRPTGLADPLVRRRIWQSALERHARSELVDGVQQAALARAAVSVSGGSPAAQVVMCIDVRSERFRRHLERAGDIETFGFAGFFGAPIRYTDEFGHEIDQCPVLLSPTHRVSARPHVVDSTVHAGRRTIASAWTTPGAPFALTEATGGLAGVMAAVHTFAPRSTTRWGHAGAPAQWHPQADLADIERTAEPAAGELPLGFWVAELVDLAYSALTTMGLTSRFAPVIVLAGHGATVQNNAFASAYDCGACGGNAGLDNARILAHALNHPQVRRSLSLRGIHVPDDTVAVAALHDTTTDELIMDRVSGSEGRDELDRFEAVSRRARAQACVERVRSLPGATPTTDPAGARRQTLTRAGDWAEACPEWGLAGNNAIVIGPRDLTRELELDGEAFLHSYEPSSDPDGTVLRTIMTAPVVVAQWINSQYYFSAVDAEHFGSGDKTTHNVVGDIGVIAGSHGDLKVGLPWQALFSDESQAGEGVGRHVPLRLSVIAFADPASVLQIVRADAGLKRLVSNEWISVTVIDPVTNEVRPLLPSLCWARPVQRAVAGESGDPSLVAI